MDKEKEANKSYFSFWQKKSVVEEVKDLSLSMD
jgi:hypothetical protein